MQSIFRVAILQIPAHKKMQQLLKTSDSLLHVLIDSLPVFIGYIDANQKYVLANKLYKEFFGVKFTFVERLHVSQVIGEDAYEKTRPHIEAGLRGEPQSYEYEVQRLGETHCIRAMYVPDIDKGKVKGIFVLGMDVTEQKQLDEKLRSAKERLEYVVDSNPAVIYLAKPLPDYSDYCTTYHSKSVASMTGFESNEFMGEKGAGFWASRVHPDDLAAYRAATPELWAKGHGTNEYRFLHKDGTYRWIREEAKVVRDSKGNVQDIIGYWTDVTDRKKMEEELKESERRYRRLFESSPLSLWEEDFSEAKKYLENLRAKGITDLRGFLFEYPDEVGKCASMVKIVNVNDATLRLYGVESMNELLGELRRVLMHESMANFREELLTLLGGKTTFSSDFENRTLAGETKHVNLILNVVPGYEDTLAKVLVTIIDLTERKQMEERLHQTERLAAIGETAAMVGHDLRNPLQALMTGLYVVKKQLASEKPEDRAEAVSLFESLGEQVIYMNKIVADLQGYSGPIAVEPVEIELTKLLKDALSTVRVPENVETTLVAQDTMRVLVDPTLMKRIMVNLVSNAIQAMPNGGRLTITVVDGPRDFSVAVQDTGLGIAPEDLTQLFTPFFTKKAKGQGLGLAVCKRMAEAQGGKITVESKLGQGSIFTVSIPLKVNVER